MKNMLDAQPAGVRASSESRQTLAKHKSVNNVKVYCLAKITGQLNTKSELNRVAAVSRTKQTAMEMVKDRYEEVKRGYEVRQEPKASNHENEKLHRQHPKPPRQHPSRHQQSELEQENDRRNRRMASPELDLFNDKFARTLDNRDGQDARESRGPYTSGRHDDKYPPNLRGTTNT